MFDRLEEILSGVQADYADLRYEVKRDVRIVFEGRLLKELGASAADGFVLRALCGGGMASVVFTKESDAERAVKDVVTNARLIGQHVERPVRLAETEVVEETFLPELTEDPRSVPMAEKLDLLRGYNDIPLAHAGIATTTTAYREVIREKHFASTEGSRVREDLVTTAVFGRIVGKDGDLTQDVRVSAGGSDGFASVRGQDENFRKRTKLALDLLGARPVTGGTYDCILDPRMAGVFAHEAFGHFSEADIIETLPAMREKMKLGEKLGNDVLSIVDDPTMPGQLGFYRYDDEGVRARRTRLMKDGVLTGRLHSRKTAAEFGEPLSGHHIAEDYRFAPIIRMGNIYIEPGEPSFEDLLAQLDNGLYIVDPKGGQTSGENFSFGAQVGYLVESGKVAGILRDINITGNLYRTLSEIVAVGDDLTLGKVGGCGKGQLNIRSCNGGPHILVRGLVVGGV